MTKHLPIQRFLAALLTIAALASGLTAQATVQTDIMMQGVTRTINNVIRFAFAIQSDWGNNQITNETGSSYTFSNVRMIHGTADVTLNGTLNFQEGTVMADVVTGSSFTMTIESSSLWFYGATVQTKSGTTVTGCTATASSNNHTLTVTIPSGKTFCRVILDFVSNSPMTASNTTVTVPAGDYWVSDSNHKPKPEPTVVYGQTTLVKGTDYTLSWSNNSSAGTGTVTVTGIGDYAGSATGTFSIRWARYYVHFDKNHDDATGTMSDQLFTYNTAQALTANTFSRTGYAFDGWSTTSNGAVTYTDGQSVSNLIAEDGETITLYAKWTLITYNITYDLDGGSVATANPTTYDVTTPDFTLNNPTKPGYTFVGWTGSNGTTPQTTVTINQGSTGDRSYTANWTLIPCLAPEDFTAGSVTATTAEFSWTGNQYAESYQIFYREAESVNVLFSENFEDETTLANWTAISNDTVNTTYGRYGRLSGAAHNGSYGYSFSSYDHASDYNQYLISPELTVSGNLEFYYKRSSVYGTEHFKVGYSSTGIEISAFTWGDEVNVSNNTWNFFFEAMPPGTKYVAINYYSNYQYQLYIDDIIIGTPVPAGAWQEATAMEAPQDQTFTVTVEGLDPETTYEAYVNIYCEYDEVTFQSDTVAFTTVSECELPDGLATDNVTESTAVISWNTYGLNEFCMRYGTDGENWTNVVLPTSIISPYTLTGLTANTLYYVQVQPTCADQTVWSQTLQFLTACPAFADVPFTENFDSYTGMTSGSVNLLPNCWNYINSTTNSTYKGYPLIAAASSLSHSVNNHLMFLSVNSSPTDQYAILPAVQNVNGLRMKLYARAYSTGTTYDATFHVGVMTDPTDSSTFTEVETITPTTTAYEHYTIPFDSYSDQGTYIAIKMDAANDTKPYHSVLIDDITVEPIPTCQEPEAPIMVSNTTTSITLQWDDNNNANPAGWQIMLNDDLTYLIDANENPFTIGDLTHSTVYSAKVRAICSPNDVSPWSEAGNLATACVAVTQFPWSEDFENYNSGDFAAYCWVNERIVDGTGEGPLSVFKVSTFSMGDNTTHQLQLPDMKIGTMTKLVLPEMNLPGSNYQFVIDVYRTDYTHTLSNNPYEGIRVFASVDGEIDGATELAFIPRQYNEENGSIPDEVTIGWYTYELPIPMSGTCYIILRGESRYCSSTYMDNFKVELSSCSAPENFAADNITTTTAEFSWTGYQYAESYHIFYREAESANLLFSEDFENGIGNWTTVDCASGSTVSSEGHSGNAFGFSYNSNPPQYLISPELTGVEDGMNLEFYYMNGSTTYPETFQIGYSSTDNETGSFTFGEEMTASDEQWHLFNEAIPAGTKYVCWKLTSNDKFHLYIDDITIGTTVPAGAWQEVTVMGAPQDQTFTVTVEGLDIETTYEAYVGLYCDNDDELVPSNFVTFTTLSLCDAPTNLTLISNDENSAHISWQGWQDAFDVHYSTDQENWTVETTPDTTIVISNLTSSTTYYVQVAAAGCEDAWSNMWSFVTDCSSTQSVPYAYDFEDNNPFNCWTSFDNRVTIAQSTDFYPYSHSGSYYMEFAGSTSNLVAMPQFGQDLSGLQLKFWTRPEDCSIHSCGTFSVGYMTDLEDAESFVEVNQYAYNDWTSNIYEQKTVFFLNAPQGTYIAFRHNPYSSPWYWFVDDVEVTVVPSCFPVKNLVVEEIDKREVMFSWDLFDETQTEWTFEYADNADFENPMMVTAEGYEGFLLEDLQPNTHYWARVAASCGTEYSDWSNVVDFTTLDACAAPVLSQVVVTSAYDAIVSWTGTSDMYNLRYRTAETKNSLFTEDFENETTFVNWMTISNNTENITDRYGRREAAACNGSYGYSFSSFSEADDYNQYLISPELTVLGNLEFYYIEFYYKNSFDFVYSSLETFRVGYSSTGNAIEDFAWGDEMKANSIWTLFQEAIPVGTKYVAINYYSDCQYELYIDDISISTPVPAGEWMTVEDIQADDYLIEGLTGGTDYEVQVQSVCVNEEPETWQWSEAVPFSTIPVTITKDIVGYGDSDGGYYLIASPIVTVNPNNVANMTANEFDLYRFNPSNEGNEWENYKAGSFNLENGRGYLYTNSDTVTLTFIGAPIADLTYEVTLMYDSTDSRKCWNLVGNPFDSSATLDREYYVLDGNGLDIDPEPVLASTPIPPCTAVFVKAVSVGDKAVFTKVTQ